MMNRIYFFRVALCGVWIGLFASALPSSADSTSASGGVDTQKNVREIKIRMRRYARGNPDPQQVREYMRTLLPGGSWADIDYENTDKADWSPAKHLRERTLPMAEAYGSPENELYHNPELAEKVVLAFGFWLENGFENPNNYWWNAIGIPKAIGQIVLLLEDRLDAEQIGRALHLMDYEARYRKSIGREDVQYWFGSGEATGQNKLWLVRIALYKAVLRGEGETVRRCFEAVADELQITPKEGIQADFSFHQHGPQLYSGSYGMAFAGDCAYFAALADRTLYGFPAGKKELLCRFLLDGQRWMTYRGTFDYSTLGRALTRKNASDVGKQCLSFCNYMAKVDTPHRAEFEQFSDQINGRQEPTLSGHRHYWCSDFSIHRRTNYCMSVKMDSIRTQGTEFGNGEGIKNYYMAAGCTFLFLRGDEYRDIFPVWDWTRIPGTTCEQASAPPKLPSFGFRNGVSCADVGNTEFVGGVSDGTYGMTAMEYQKCAVKARKAWFFFEDEIVCLGAGIDSGSDLPVATSVNQCLLNSPVFSNGKELPQGTHRLEAPAQVWHDGIGYLFPGKETVFLKNETQAGSWHFINTSYPDEPVSKNVFSLWFGHGIAPTNDTYCYVVVPAADCTAFEKYSTNPKVNILENTPKLQAVHHPALEITQAAFYRSGRLDLPKGQSVCVDKPCLLMLRRDGAGVRVAVSNPGNKPLEVQVLLTLAGIDPAQSRLVFNLPDGLDAGKTIIKTIPGNKDADEF